MKNIFIVLGVLCFWISPSRAQEESISPFLFEDYKEATVFIGMNQAKGKLNFYMPTGDFLYIDESDNNQVKILSRPEEISMIRFGTRIFLPSVKGGVEVLSTEPVFYVQYKASIRDKGKIVGYGGTSSIGGVKSYSLNSSGTAFVSDPMTLVVGQLYNVYYLGKKQKEIKSMKQFLKYYSKHQETLEKYIKEKNIKFNDALQMLQLVQYAHSLD